MATGEAGQNGLPEEPGILARCFVYAFVFCSPVLVLLAAVVPAGVFVRLNDTRFDVAGTVLAGIAAASVMFAGLRAVRSLTPRFSPPLALPGDIWNAGSPSPPKRSSNWPIRLRRRPAVSA